MITKPSDGTSRSSQREVNHKNKGKNSNINTNKRKSTSLPSETVEYLKAWMMSPEHIAHPYPTEQEKAQIMADTGIELKQLTNWFVNNRKRYWKPRVEAKLHEQHGKTNASGYGDANKQLPQSQPLARLAPLMAESNNNSVPTDMPFSLNSIISANPQSFLPPSVEPNEDAESVTGATKLARTTTNLPHVVTPSRRSSLTLTAKEAPSTSTSLLPMAPTNSTMVSETDETASYSALSTLSDSESVNPPLPPSLSRTSSRHNSANSLYETSTTITERVALWMVQPHEDSVVGQSPYLDMVMEVPEGEKAPPGYNEETFTVLQVFENCPLTYTIVRDVRTDITICSNREEELKRLKMRYFERYLSRPLSTSASSGVREPTVSSATDSSVAASDAASGVVAPLKRARSVSCETDRSANGRNDTDDAEEYLAPRPKYRRVSLKLWKDACQSAEHAFNDCDLPSLEEAAQLFGYASTLSA